MRHEYVLGVGSIVIILSLIAVGIRYKWDNKIVANPEAVSEIFAPPRVSGDGGIAEINNVIIVDEPHRNIRVTSPLVIKGKVRGGWFFEAVFPIRIVDDQGVELGRTTAHAKGEWTTNEFVPFEATLTFKRNASYSATIILEKDNPSGLPENDQALKLPIAL